MLGVSRGSVRDAIRSLELMGLLEPRQGVGTVVCRPGANAANPLANALLDKRKMVAELLDVRKMIGRPWPRAPPCTVLPMKFPTWKTFLRGRKPRCAGAKSESKRILSFTTASPWRPATAWSSKVVDVLMDLLRETRERSLQVEGRQEKSLAGHRRILSALKQGDAAAAEAAMRRHLQEVENIVLKKL